MLARVLRLVVVTLTLASGLVLVPVPRIVWAAELETEHHRPALLAVRGTPAAVSGAVVPPAAGTDEPAISSSGETPAASAASRGSAGSSYRVARDVDLDPFTTIGITTSREPSGPVVVRTASSGSWSDWRQLSFGEDHAPDGEESRRGRAGHTTEPYFVGRADAYEIQIPAGSGAVEVHLVTERTRRITVGDSTPRADAGPRPGIRSRGEWGARAPAVSPSIADSLELAVVHHSVNSNAYSAGQVPALLRSIQAYHMDANGWNDIAYNFAVDRFGRIWEARAGGVDEVVIGGHSYGFNTGSTGVVVLGDYGSATPSAASVDAVGELISWKLARHRTPPTGTVTYRSAAATHFGPAGTPVTVNRISGHRNVRQTSCPGNALYGRLGSIRDRVAARYAAYQPDAEPVLLTGDGTGEGFDDVLVYRPGSAKDPRWRGLVGPDLLSGQTSVTGLFEPLSGDFDGDGRHDVFWYRPGGAADYVWYGQLDGGHRSVRTQVLGQYEPFVGDFDGDGRDDIFWYGLFETRDSIWYGAAGGFTRRAADAGFRLEPLVGDFDGDGRDDIVWYGRGSLPDATWYGTAQRSWDARATGVGGYYEPLVGDFNGDTVDDVFWYRPGSGADYVWSGRPTRSFGSVATPVNGTYRPFTGDFDGNGVDDIFWYAPGSARDYQWWFSLLGRSSTAKGVSGDYETATLDVDGDGDDEILWLRSPTSGYLWTSGAGNTFTSQPAP